MKKLLSILLLTTLAFAAPAQQIQPWQSPAVMGINKELPRTQLLSYASAAQAIAREQTNSLYIKMIDEGWNAHTSESGVTLTASFAMPFAWIDRQLLLRVPSAPSSFTVKVNSKEVGYSQGSKTPAEFDITKLCKEGLNEVEITIVRAPACQILESYKTATTPGVATSVATPAPNGVCVLAQPRIRIRDIAVDASFGENGVGTLSLSAFIKSHLLNKKQMRLHYELLSPEGKSLSTSYRDVNFEMREEETAGFFEHIPGILPWSAQSPSLYTVILKLQSEGRYIEYVAVKIGFRTIAVSNKQLTINKSSQRLIFTDFTPTGDLNKDEAAISILKRKGTNALRLLPHPQSEAFYSMCDRIGIYLCDQADIDTHLSGNSRLRNGNPTNDPQWAPAYIDRAVAMYHNSKNHPSVILYSLANQSSNGYCLYESYTALNALNPGRPIVYTEAGGEWNSDAVSFTGGVFEFRE